MFNKLAEVEEKYHNVSNLLATPEIATNPPLYQRHAKELADMTPVVEAFQHYKKITEELEQSEEMLKIESDEDLVEMIKEELVELKKKQDYLFRKLRMLLLPKDPLDEKNTLLEIRAGTGGEEAALFAADLLRAYSRYAERRRWKLEIMTCNETGIGGIKEVVMMIEGDRVFSRLKYEGGVHRVQRVPDTETQGRIHTSAVTVAVLPEAEEVDVNIADRDIRIDVYRSSGPGGQSVNTTDSAVRITHVETGLVVTCQDEKSQHKNRAKALKILRSRLLDMERAQQQAQIAKDRKVQVGSGDRSERIRTYNFPQNRVTDHRINLTLYKLGLIMEGDLDMMIDSLISWYQAEALKMGTTQEAPDKEARK